MPARNTDGTIRNARSPMILKPRSIRARWVTDEILRCKRTGLSMAAIAVHIGRAGQGHEQPLSPFPDGIEFPADYRLSESAVFKAYHKAMNQQPAINAEVFRKEDTARCEENVPEAAKRHQQGRSAPHRYRCARLGSQSKAQWICHRARASERFWQFRNSPPLGW